MPLSLDVIDFLYEAKQSFHSLDLTNGEITEVHQLVEILEDVWPNPEDDMYMNWAGVIVPINKRYELTYIFEELFCFYQWLSYKEHGVEHFDLATSGFQLLIDAEISSKVVNISAEWREVSNKVKIESLANELALSRFDLIENITKLFSKINDDLSLLGVQFKKLDALIEANNAS